MRVANILKYLGLFASAAAIFSDPVAVRAAADARRFSALGNVIVDPTSSLPTLNVNASIREHITFEPSILDNPETASRVKELFNGADESIFTDPVKFNSWATANNIKTAENLLNRAKALKNNKSLLKTDFEEIIKECRAAIPLAPSEDKKLLLSACSLSYMELVTRFSDIDSKTKNKYLKQSREDLLIYLQEAEIDNSDPTSTYLMLANNHRFAMEIEKDKAKAIAHIKSSIAYCKKVIRPNQTKEKLLEGAYKMLKGAYTLLWEMTGKTKYLQDAIATLDQFLNLAPETITLEEKREILVDKARVCLELKNREIKADIRERYSQELENCLKEISEINNNLVREKPKLQMS
jgi:hypothetical protein